MTVVEGIIMGLVETAPTSPIYSFDPRFWEELKKSQRFFCTNKEKEKK
jgi:hypothetical protein